MGTDRRKLIERASQAVRKAFGPDASVRAAVDLAYPSVWASTGSHVLDRIIAGRLPGGIPFGPRRGKVIHVFGLWSLGKSVLVEMVAKVVQQELKGLTLISETEGSRDPHFADAVGLDLHEVEIQHPNTIEELFDFGLEWHTEIRKQDAEIPVFWAIDSFETIEAGQTFGVKMSGKEGGAYEFGGGRAGKIGAGMRKLANICGKYPTSVLALNQLRERPGVMFGDKTQSTGGKSPKFLASCEIKLSSSKFGVIEKDGRAVARWVHAKAVKNKISPPFAEGDFLIDFARGLQRWPGVAEMLEAEGIVVLDLKSREFTVKATGEVLPMAQFVTWCQTSKVLEQ